MLGVVRLELVQRRRLPSRVDVRPAGRRGSRPSCATACPTASAARSRSAATTASGYSWRIARTSGSADSRIEKMCSGPARKSSIAWFWIATVEYSRHRRCLMVALRWLAIRPRSLPGPVQRRDDEPVAQVEVGLPVDGVVLVAPRHVPDRGTGQGDGRIAGSPARRPYSASSHLMNSGSGWPSSSATCARDHAHPPAVVVDVDAAVQQLCEFSSSLSGYFGEVVVVLGVGRVGPHEVPGVDDLAHHVQVAAAPAG